MSPKNSTGNNDRPFDPLVFWVSAVITILFVLWSIVFPANMERVINRIFNWTTQGWGWLYLLTVFALVIACFVLSSPNSGA